MAQFVPRQVFPHHGAIPRSYFLGHHRAGLTKMKNMLSSIDYVVECRDYRAPVTSINPMFEEALGSIRRLIVYTKKDLGAIPQSPLQQLVSFLGLTTPNNPFDINNFSIDRTKSSKFRSEQHSLFHKFVLPPRRRENHQTPPPRSTSPR